MVRVMARIPEVMLAERHRLGLDRRDEVWEGVYHMVPPAGYWHQRLGTELVLLLGPLVRENGLEVAYEVGVIAPGVADWSDFKVPDLVVARPEYRSERGVEGRAELVVEIRSPGDETFEKVGWYGRVGVQELLVIDRDTKQVRQWLLGGSVLVETEPDGEGWFSCRALPVRLRSSPDAALEGGTLEVDTGGDVTRI